MRRRSCRLPAGLGRAAADRSSAEPSSKPGTQSARHGGGTGKRTHRASVARASCSVGEHRDFMCF